MLDSTATTPEPAPLAPRRTDLRAIHKQIQAVTSARRDWAALASLACSPAEREALRAEALAASRAGTSLYQRLTDDVLRLAPYLAPGSLVVELAQERAAQAGDVAAYDAAERILGVADALAEIVVIDSPAASRECPGTSGGPRPVGGHDRWHE